MNYNLRRRNSGNGPLGTDILSSSSSSSSTSSNNNQSEQENTTSSRTVDLQEQHYNQINNNHVIDEITGLHESEPTTSTATVACDDAEPYSILNPTVTPTGNSSNESPSKTVDTRIPVYV